MKRSQRLELVQRVVDDTERRKAQALAACDKRIAESESKLQELETYRASYARDFTTRAGAGISATSARDFQVFLGKLDEAVRQQAQIVMRTKAQRETELKNWQNAAQRADAVGQMVTHWKADEQRTLDKREQQESDERALRSWSNGLIPRGA